MTLEAYLELCKTDRLAFATAAERFIEAVGQPRIVDTSDDPRLSRIHSNQKIRVYDAFSDFYGMEAAVERVVAFFRHASQGLEESKQILYLLGPVGGGKSSLSERIKALVEKHPMYALYDDSEPNPELRISPVFESPLNLFNPSAPADAEVLTEYGIPLSYAGRSPLSGWAQQKLDEFKAAGKDFTAFKVVRLYPSKDRQIGIMKVEPGDENNQDVSVLIGKTDLRKLEQYPQNHPYAYSYSGGLNRTTQGLMEFAEMFKANIKTLNPLLMATQDRSYKGTEAIPALPYNGVIMAHSNESEWETFRNNKTNEAFLDRVFIVNVPYCLRYDEEESIYQKMLKSSVLSNVPVAPGTLKMLAQWSVLTRLKEPENSTIAAKLAVYNGDSVKDKMPNVKSLEEYMEAAGPREGMTGMSTRFAFKVLSSVINFRPEELQANPVDLMFVLTEALKKEGLPPETQEKFENFIKEILQPRYFETLEKELRAAYLDSFAAFGQNLFERYIKFAEAWLADEQCKDPETHQLLDRKKLNDELESIEKTSGIHNAKDFRQDIVTYVLRFKSRNAGASPAWTEYEKIRVVLEKRMFSATENIMPVISFGPKHDRELEDKHNAFITRMLDKGYTELQVKQLVAWWSNNKRAA
jgi:serine protein kinase